MTEYNARSEARKIDRIHGLAHDLPWPLSAAKWPDMMYMLHRFDHPDYVRKDNLIAEGYAPLPAAQQLKGWRRGHGAR
jgi:hypothetical protein